MLRHLFNSGLAIHGTIFSQIIRCTYQSQLVILTEALSYHHTPCKLMPCYASLLVYDLHNSVLLQLWMCFMHSWKKRLMKKKKLKVWFQLLGLPIENKTSGAVNVMEPTAESLKVFFLFVWRLTLKLAGCWQDNPMPARQLLFHSLVKGHAGWQKSFLLTRLISFISPAACLFACQVLPGSECVGGVRRGATATLMHLWSLSWSP